MYYALYLYYIIYYILYQSNIALHYRRNRRTLAASCGTGEANPNISVTGS